MTSTDISNGQIDIATDAYLQSDQKLVLTGYQYTNTFSFVAARYFIDVGTGIAQADNPSAQFKVYPNPTGDLLHISATSSGGVLADH